MKNKINNYEKLKSLVLKAFENLLKWTETEADIPDEGIYSQYWFTMPGRDNKGSVKIQKFGDNDWRLRVYSTIGNTGYDISSYFFMCDSKEKIQAYLSDENSIEQVANKFVNLNEKADRKAKEYPFC